MLPGGHSPIQSGICVLGDTEVSSCGLSPPQHQEGCGWRPQGTGQAWGASLSYEAACCHLSLCTSFPRASAQQKISSCSLTYLEKDLSARIDSPCSETNASQTAAGLSYPLKYSCGGVMWNMFPFKMLVSFDVCANECAILSLRLPKSVTCWRLCTVCFSNDTS